MSPTPRTLLSCRPCKVAVSDIFLPRRYTQAVPACETTRQQHFSEGKAEHILDFTSQEAGQSVAESKLFFSPVFLWGLSGVVLCHRVQACRSSLQSHNPRRPSDASAAILLFYKYFEDIGWMEVGFVVRVLIAMRSIRLPPADPQQPVRPPYPESNLMGITKVRHNI